MSKHHGDSAHTKCNLKYSVTKKIPIDFYNVSNYGLHFIIKELAVAFQKQFTCFRENTEKYNPFSVPIQKKVTITYKNAEESTKNTSYRLKFIDSLRFTATPLPNFVNNIDEKIHKIKWKYKHDVFDNF